MSQLPLQLLSNQTPEQQVKLLLADAKALCESGQLGASLAKCQAAYSLQPSEKLAGKMRKLRRYIAEEEADHDKEENDEEEENFVVIRKTKKRQSYTENLQEDATPPSRSSASSSSSSKTAELCPGFSLSRRLADKLYQHQREGVAWLYGLHRCGKGGILADDMGLGKTVQIIAFLSGLIDSGEIRSALLIMPVSVMMTWEKEFRNWAPRVPVYYYHGMTKVQMANNLSRVQRRPGVLITTYGMVVSNWESLGRDDRNRSYQWDYVILDEGHKIKNSTRKTSKGVFSIDAKHRLILTGTAVQNNLMEMWTLFDFVHHGALLGSQRTFKLEYERPISRSREKDATAGERRYGDQMAESLKARIGPYFLRRTKQQVEKATKELRKKNAEDGEGDSIATMPSLKRKNDIVVWIYLSATQQTIYRDFLQLDSVKELLVGSNKRSPLVELTVLKKICDHPRLLSANHCHALGLRAASDIFGTESVNPADGVPTDQLMEESSKMAFVADLMDQLRLEGHRTLIFSQSRKMLDIVEKILNSRGHKLCRLDGTVTQLMERQQIVEKFSRDRKINAFLLTTQVGGVGLTLTAADRVVILDPSWNPAVDAQAVDRAFRIGQEQNVLIYRLITCATVEEKIYRRQIFKDSITRQTTGIATTDKNPYRYFTKQELRELFTLGDPTHSATQQQLAELHAKQRRTDADLDSHLAFLHSMNIFGISDHDLMFSQEDEGQPETDEAFGGNDGFVEQRRLQVEQAMQRESEENAMERDTRINMSRMELSIYTPSSKPQQQQQPVGAKEKIQATFEQFIPLSRPIIKSGGSAPASEFEQFKRPTMPPPPPPKSIKNIGDVVENDVDKIVNSLSNSMLVMSISDDDDIPDQRQSGGDGETEAEKEEKGSLGPMDFNEVRAANSFEIVDDRREHESPGGYKTEYKEHKSAYESVDEIVDESMGKSIDTSVEIGVSKSAEASVDKSADTSVDTSVDKSATKSVDKSADTSVDKSADTSVDKSVTKSVDKSADTSVDKSADTSVDKSADTSVGKSADTSVDKQEDKSVNDSDGESDGEFDDASLTGSEELKAIGDDVQPAKSSVAYEVDGGGGESSFEDDGNNSYDEEVEEEPIEVMELSSSDESFQEALKSQEMHSLLSKSFGEQLQTSDVELDSSGVVAASGGGRRVATLAPDSFEESPRVSRLQQLQRHHRPSDSSTPLRRRLTVGGVADTPPADSADVSMMSVSRGADTSVDASPLLRLGGARKPIIIDSDESDN